MDKILVCLKRVVDYNVRIRVKPDGSGVLTEGLKMSINPFDEIALEEALRIRERGDAAKVIVLSVGTSDCQQQLRTGLAMGADRGILIETDASLEPLGAAGAILKIIEKENPGLVIMGKQAIDDDCNQTAQMLSTLWGKPQATFASTLELSDGKAKVSREVDAGLEVIEVDLPAVISTDLRLNQPRFVKLPDIMKAKKKPLETISLSDLGIDAAPFFDIQGYESPPERAKGAMVEDVAGLVGALKEKGFFA